MYKTIFILSLTILIMATSIAMPPKIGIPELRDALETTNLITSSTESSTAIIAAQLNELKEGNKANSTYIITLNVDEKPYKLYVISTKLLQTGNIDDVKQNKIHADNIEITQSIPYSEQDALNLVNMITGSIEGLNSVSATNLVYGARIDGEYSAPMGNNLKLSWDVFLVKS